MKSYLSLIPISAKVHRKQNRMTILCIMIAVFLVTGVFSMADMAVRAEKANMIEKHGNWHIRLHEIDESTAERIRSEPKVAASSRYDVINYGLDKDYYIGGKKCALVEAEEDFVTDIMISEYTGSFPQDAQEVMLSSNARDVLGIAIGEKIAVDTPVGALHYTVSGFKYEESAEFYDGVVVFMNREGFAQALSRLGSQESYPEYYIQFKPHVNMKKIIAAIRDKYGLTENTMAENTGVLGMEGVSGNSYMVSLYGIAAFLFLLVLIAGALMISSSMSSNVSERTMFFGMLRCTGASRQQIIRFVRLEALSWCKRAIPMGVGLAVLVTWMLCGLMRYIIGGEFSHIPLFQVSAVGIVCGIVVGVAAVMVAAGSPAKRAAGVSPIAAVSGNAYHMKEVRHTTHFRLGKIETSLGVHHAVSSRKNLMLMTFSYAISIILFLCFSSFIGFIRCAMPSLRGYTPDMSVTAIDGACSVSRELYDKIHGHHGVKAVYGSMFQLHTPVISDRTDEVDLISYDGYMMDWSRDNALIDGDVSKILGDSRYAYTIHNKTSTLQKGDKIQIGGEEIEIAGEFSTGIWSDGKATVVCSEETFMRLTGKSDYTILSIKLSGDASESDITFLRSLAGENSLIDYRESNRQSRSTYWLFHILVDGFLAMIAMITVIHIVNCISMSVSAKKKQYGAMRAIGMDGTQLTRMLTAETAAYAVLGCMIGTAAGVPLHKSLFETMVTSYFGTPWEFPYVPFAVILILVVASCAAAVYGPAKRIRNMTVADVMNV